MVCKKCGAYLETNASFCSGCGARLIVGEEFSRIEKRCPLCNNLISDEDEICPNCGAELKFKAEEMNNLQGEQNEEINSKETPSYVKNDNFVINIPENQTPPSEKPVKVSQYIGWMLLSMIPFAGFILTIVFACDSSKKSRANFFRALLIMYAIIVGLSIIFIILVFALGFSSGEMFDYISNNLVI